MISARLENVRERIRKACQRVGRDPAEIRLVCVTKGIDIDRISDALANGAAEIGENKVQEALEKHRVIGDRTVWHMIGHLQSNKAPEAVKIFSLIHSVDSVKIAAAIDRSCHNAKKVQEVLVQVNISGERSKFGIAPDTLAVFLDEIAQFTHIRIMGLMGMAPESPDPERTRPSFRLLKRLFDSTRPKALPNGMMTYLSMGMSQDFEVAIEEGAHIVRIGSAIFL